MGEIVLARVDDRLVHGQVMTSWLNFLSANRIVIVDDMTAQDMFMRTILESVIPANIKIDICTITDGIKVLSNLRDSDKVIVLAKFPGSLASLVEAGVDIKAVNIGGMGAMPGRRKLFKNISASDDERACYKSLIDKGIEVSVQIIAEDKKQDVSKYL